MSNQLQIESYRISMRKLRTFYRKVTEFLNDDKITCLHRLCVIVIIELYRRAEQTVYLCKRIGYLCKSLTGGVYIYFLPYARGYDSVLDDFQESLVSVQKCHNAPICGLFVKPANFIFKFLSLKISLIQADCHWK